ncbi:MAG: sigma-70 family RNA polymerase sigma factor [Myxococcota bacterium]
MLARTSGARAKFRLTTRALASRLPRADRLGAAARNAEEATGAYVRARPTASRLAHLTTVEVVGSNYLELRNRLLDRHIGLVHVAASRLKASNLYEDMVHEGLFGLMRALECFDPTRGTKFSTYAMYWIRTQMIRAKTLKEREIRVPRHLLGNRRAYTQSLARLDTGQPREQLREMARKASGLTQRQLLAVERIPEVQSDALGVHHDDDADPVAQIHVRRLVQRVWSAIPDLAPLEQRVLGHRFELEGLPFRTLAELGHDLGLSRERVRQIQLRALDKLRLQLAPVHDEQMARAEQAA